MSLDTRAFLVPPSPSTLRLSDYDAASKGGFDDKEESQACLQDDVEQLCKLHDVFAAQSKHALLVVLQGMDTAGKDGIIKHVMSGMNPQGVSVYGFRKPSEEELRHDFLWRESKVLPERGRITIFNRSYYEEVLILKVIPQLLESEGAAGGDPTEWERRYEDINAFERHLTNTGTIVLKFCLHLSKNEQRRRLLARLEDPKKMWKASDADLEGHEQWDEYVAAYEAMLGHTSTPWAPWYLVPADRKWVTRAVVGGAIVEALQRLDLKYPEPNAERRELFARLATQLRGEDR
ncbi:MAG: polyphosphate kinase 2 family protein [Candidatus Eremiobacteraeota bacterium]|nr:polyphosphate kinase 2 family protein [Candidatus Eremiobacteraeota bacterium]